MARVEFQASLDGLEATLQEQGELVLRALRGAVDVLRSQDLRVKTAVPNTLTGEDDLSVELKFDSMKSFEPEAVARQASAGT